jgi:hypothetical protein
VCGENIVLENDGKMFCDGRTPLNLRQRLYTLTVLRGQDVMHVIEEKNVDGLDANCEWIEGVRD